MSNIFLQIVTLLLRAGSRAVRLRIATNEILNGRNYCLIVMKCTHAYIKKFTDVFAGPLTQLADCDFDTPTLNAFIEDVRRLTSFIG